jgi:Flp pilus assembly pilin Flp
MQVVDGRRWAMARLLGWVRMLRQKQGQDLAEYALLLPVVFIILMVFDMLTGAIGAKFNVLRDVLSAVTSGHP